MSTKLATWLAAELDTVGWSQRELSRRAGVSSSTISRVITGSIAVTAKFCKAIAGPLKTTPEDLMIMAGILAPPAAPVENETECLDYYRQLDEEGRAQARAILKVLAETRGPYK